MNEYLIFAVVVTLLALLPVIASIAYAVALRTSLVRRTRFVLVASWLAYGVYGAMLALSLPLVTASEPLLSGVCDENSSSPALACTFGRWTYEFGWMVGIAIWLILAALVIHKLARKYWNPVAAVVWPANEG
jgi:hypothetical protein